MRDLTNRPLIILLVEDDADDAELEKMALQGNKVVSRISVVTDGAEALAFLRRQGKYQDAETPDFVLLDINLSKLNGHEVLAEMKKDPELKRIPVVMLTSSDAERDIAKSYELGASSYIIKPVDMEKFASVLQAVERFWADIAALPPKRISQGMGNG